jgi:hypothetical protein
MRGAASYRQLGALPVAPPADGAAAAVAIPSRDVFADPPGLAVREDLLRAVGGPEPVRAGALADLVARLEAAGHAVEVRDAAAALRRATPSALLREGAGRLWLFRRHPQRHPLPRPRDVGRLRYPLLALGALHANGAPTRSRAADAGERQRQ